MKIKKGFTLVELLVVIGIICILAAVMVPVLTGVLNKTNEQADEVSAGLYTSVMQQFANEKAGEALLYPNLTTTGADAEYSVLYDKAGQGMFPGYNILELDNDDDVYAAIRREAVIAIKAYSDTKILNGYYVAPPTKDHYHYVYYYLTGQVKVEDERTKTPVSESEVASGVINVEDYWVYLSRDGGSGDAIMNTTNGTGNVFIQIRQFGTDELLEGVRVTLRVGSELMTATTGPNGTVGFSGIVPGSCFVEAEKQGAISFPDSRFYTESGSITVRSGGYIGDSAANPYVITMKMGTLGSLGFYQRTNTWDGSSWSVSDAYITSDLDITSAFTVDTSRPVEAAKAETYYTNAASNLGRQELLTSDGKFLLYGPYYLRVSASGYRDYTEYVVSRVYGIDNYKNGGVGEHATATAPYEYPIVLRKANGSGVVSGTVTWERSQQPLAGTVSATGSWIASDYNYSVSTRVVMTNKSTGSKYYSSYFTANTSGQYPFTISGLPDGEYTITLETPYGQNSSLDLSGFPETVTVDGTENVINARVVYADVDYGSAGITVTYDSRGNNDPIPGASVQLVRLGSVTYAAKTTNDDGYCSFASIKRGFYQIKVTVPSYIGSATYTYRFFVDGAESVTIRLPISAITLTGVVSGYKPNGDAMDIEGSLEGLTIKFHRYNEAGSKKYSTVDATVLDDTGLTASYSVTIVPGNYKIETETTCYQEYPYGHVVQNFVGSGTFNFWLNIDDENIICHPNAEIIWHQNSSHHWKECGKCGTVFGYEAHKYSSWTASGATGCYRYCTEPNCNRTLDPVTAHDYRYTAAGSYASTCVKNGNNHYECYRCAYGKDEPIPTGGHRFGMWTPDNDSTHTRKCQNSGCTASETENHSWGSWYWVSRDIRMSTEGSYCYSTGTQRADCQTCGHYKFNYPKVAHAIDCFIMREYISGDTYYNFPAEYDSQSVFFVTAAGRVYHLLAPSTSYSGRRVYGPSDPDDGLYGHTEFFTSRTASRFGDSAIFSKTSHSHLVSCSNAPAVNGVTHYCYAPINHNGNPYRTTNRCGCSNKPMGYIRTAAGVELYPALNPNWENPYEKQGRYYGG